MAEDKDRFIAERICYYMEEKNFGRALAEMLADRDWREHLEFDSKKDKDKMEAKKIKTTKQGAGPMTIGELRKGFAPENAAEIKKDKKSGTHLTIDLHEEDGRCSFEIKCSSEDAVFSVNNVIGMLSDCLKGNIEPATGEKVEQ